MKKGNTKFFVLGSSFALLLVLVIQVVWIVRTAKIKEELFNEKANMVLSRTAEVLSEDKEACRSLENFTGQNELHKADSLINNYMNFYDFRIKYSWQVKQPNPDTAPPENNSKTNVYKKKLDEEVSKNGLELNLLLPQKKQFIVAELGPVFITSVILIVVIFILFLRTVRSLMNEKMISEQTTDFLNNMTHEFKTPLTNIALAAKMIARQPAGTDSSKVNYYAEIITRENEKLSMQVEQVLNMAALERGEIPLAKSVLDIHDVISEAAESMHMQCEAFHGKIFLRLTADSAKLNGDKSHLINVIRNLIDNALKYAQPDPEIVISTLNENDFIVIKVSDNGKGIENRFHEKIFDPYFRVPSGDIHDVKGSGLGLAYARKIISLHNGAIRMESTNGNGSSVIITLPHA